MVHNFTKAGTCDKDTFLVRANLFYLRVHSFILFYRKGY